MYRHLASPLIVVAIAAVLGGCLAEPEIRPLTEPPHVLFVPSNDVTKALAPSPNDLALDPDLGTPVLSMIAPPGATGAMLAFLQAYVTRLAGWLPLLPWAVELSEPVDPASVTESMVVVVDATDALSNPNGKLVPVSGYAVSAGERTPAGDPRYAGLAKIGVITVTPPAGGFPVGRRLAAVLKKGPQTTGKVPFVAPLAFNFFRSRDPVATFKGEPTIENARAITPELFFEPADLAAIDAEDDLAKKAKLRDKAIATSNATAGHIELVRRNYDAILKAAERPDSPVALDRKDVIALWQVSIAGEPKAIFDSDKGIIPMPNDALRDPTTQTLAIPVKPDATPIDQELFGFLNTLDGWSVTSQVAIPVSAPLDPTSVTGDSVLVLDVTTKTPVTDAVVRYDAENQRIVVGAPQQKGGWTATRTYAVLVTTQITHATLKNLHLVADAPTAIGLLNVAVADDKGHSLLPGVLTDAQAMQLEALRKGLFKPTLTQFQQAFSKLGLDERDVAAIVPFTITSRAEAIFNPSGAGVMGLPDLPFPTDLALDFDDQQQPIGLKPIPPAPGDSPLVAAMKVGLGTLDGFGASSPAFVRFSRSVDAKITTNGKPPIAAALKDAATAAVALVDITDPAKVFDATKAAEIFVPAELKWDKGALFISPPEGRPLAPKHHYLLLLLDKLQGDVTLDQCGAGACQTVPTPIFALVRSANPIAKWVAKADQKDVSCDALVAAYGGGTLDTLACTGSLSSAATPAEACQLEILRCNYAFLFSALSGAVARESILALTTFWTGDTDGKLVALGDAIVADPSAGTLQGSATLVDAVAAGDDATLVKMSPGAASALKASPHVGKVLLDGMFAGKALVGDVSDGSPKAFAIDGKGKPKFHDVTFHFSVALPKDVTTTIPIVVYQHMLQGTRFDAFKVADAFCAQGLALVSIDAPYHGDHPVRLAGKPSGEGLITADLFATRDGLRELVLDHLQLIEMTRELGKWLGVSLDPGASRYVGVSLGGVVGGMTTTVSKDIKRAVFNVAGASFSKMLLDPQGSAFKKPVDDALAAAGFQKGTLPYVIFIRVIAQWLLDPADPVNFVPRVGAGSPDEKPVLLQMAVADELVPNASTHVLRKALGLAEDGTASPKGSRFESYTDKMPNGLKALCHFFFVDGCSSSLFPGYKAIQDNARQSAAAFLKVQ